MGTQQQGQQTATAQGRSRRYPWKRLSIVITVVLIILIAATLGILYSSITLAVSLSSAMLIALGILVNLFQWLFPVPVEIEDPQGTQPTTGTITLIGQGTTPSLHETPTPSVPVNTAFLFCVPLTDVNEFYGRVSERNTILSRTHKRASTSIIGRRRIGKTWLLEYTCLVLREEPGHKFRIGLLDANAPGCTTVSKFTAQALKALDAPHRPRTVLTLDKLEDFARELKEKNCTPVLCIDEFEGFARQPQEFNLDFFNGLRSIAQYAGLVLVIASKKPLIDIVIDIVGDTGKTSPFFNVFEQITLHPFTRREAEIFAREKCSQVGFTIKEQGFLLQYGRLDTEQWPPLRLQLAGKILLEDKSRIEGDPYCYQPDEPDYWKEFKTRLEEIYRGVVRE
ncbi:MAG: TniB family NTP-binding protein [Chloroflexi bacterium]|nr:TniB family NTP-binding protein [Chloroflexota bacterium]